MDAFFFFLIAGLTIVVLILKFDKKQTIKINTVLKETRSVPPMFLLKLTEQKIASLKIALRFDDLPQNMGAAASMANMYNNQNENNRLSKVQEFKLLSSKYNNGALSLEAYNVKLDELLGQLHNQNGSYVLAS
jgi:hypothetical protein